MKISLLTSTAALAGLLAIARTAAAQFGPPQRLHRPMPPAEQAAPIDLTGYWTAVVTEDWRWRMLTAPRGDYASVPLSRAGVRIADQFNPALYGSPTSQRIDCRAYYMAGVMRMPVRLHITWATRNVLRIQTDWGEQSRMIYFRRPDMPESLQQPSPQGASFGVWQHPIRAAGGMGGFRRGPTPALPGGDLMVRTDHLMPGWLRRNGVPYSGKTTVIEYFQTFHDPTGKKWFDVTTIVNDPVDLARPFITSSDFRQEPNGSKWAPHPCVDVAAGPGSPD